MARKGENIFRRIDKRWEGRYKKGRKPNGKIIYGFVYGKSYKEVKLKLVDLKYKYMHSEKDLISFDGTVFDWSTCYMNKVLNSGVKSSTYALYNTILHNHILSYFKDKKLISITKNDVEEFARCLTGKGLGGTSASGVFGLLNRMLRYAVMQKVLLTNPCDNVALFKKEPRKIEALTGAEQKKLEQTALKDECGIAVILALFTGMRIGEISALRWDAVDFRTGMIHVKETVQRIADVSGKNKTRVIFDSPKSENSVRVIPMPDKIKKWLQTIRKNAKGEFVVACKNKFAEPRVIRYRYSKIIEKAGIKYVPFHSLRHTFATRCMELSFDPASLSRLMGHSSSKMTLDVYTDSMLEQRVISMGRLNKLFDFSLETEVV